MILTDILENSARKYAQRPALSMRMGYRTTTLTYAQVFQHVRLIARYLIEQGIEQGDCILLCAPNSPWWICSWWACVLIGAKVVPLAPENSLAMLTKILQQTEAKLFLRGLTVHHDLPVRTVTLEHLPFLSKHGVPFDHTTRPLRPFDCAEIMYTSGTTGDPKGVMLTHENIMSTVQGLRHILHLDGGKERLLSVLPLSHMFEQVIGYLLPCAEGAHVIYAHSHGAIRQLLVRYHITTMIAVPEFLKVMSMQIQGSLQKWYLLKPFNFLLLVARMLRFKPLQRLLLFPVHQRLGGCLKTIASGGAPLTAELEQWWQDCGVWVLQGYGLTETSPVVSTNTWQAYKHGSVGRPMKHVQVHIADDGEIAIKGPNVFVGYFKNPEKTAASFNRDHFFTTGDIGYLDRDGFLFLKGRKKYMILSASGQNVFPEDIEQVLNEQAAVLDSCVLGVETESGQTAICAVLLLKDSTADCKQIVAAANQKLAAYQHITAWQVWPETDFPRSITKKIKRDEVMKQVVLQRTTGGQPVGKVTPLLHIMSRIVGKPVGELHPDLCLVSDLQFDSLMRVELVTAIEEQLHVLIDETALTATTTIKDLDALLHSPQRVSKPPAAAVWPRAWWAVGLRRVFQAVFSLALRWFFRMRIEGLEHLHHSGGPVIFMPNHVSLLDGPVVTAALPGSLAVRNSFAAGYDVLYGDYRWAAVFVELFFNAFPFPRKESDHIATGLQNLGGMLDAGYHATIFPEGEMSLDGFLRPLKKGAGMIAPMMQAPIVPVKIIGLEAAVPYNCLLPRRRGRVTVRFGKPLVFDPLMDQEEALAIITKALQEL
jgi:long-chain acyl-CoA synthetase